MRICGSCGWADPRLTPDVPRGRVSPLPIAATNESNELSPAQGWAPCQKVVKPQPTRGSLISPFPVGLKLQKAEIPGFYPD